MSAVCAVRAKVQACAVRADKLQNNTMIQERSSSKNDIFL